MSALRPAAPWRLALIGLLVLLLPLKTLAALLGAPGCAGHRAADLVQLSAMAAGAGAGAGDAAAAARAEPRVPCHEHGVAAAHVAAMGVVDAPDAADAAAAEEASASSLAPSAADASAGCCHCAPCNAVAAPAPNVWQAPEPGPTPVPAARAERLGPAVVAEVPHHPPRQPL